MRRSLPEGGSIRELQTHDARHRRQSSGAADLQRAAATTAARTHRLLCCCKLDSFQRSSATIQSVLVHQARHEGVQRGLGVEVSSQPAARDATAAG